MNPVDRIKLIKQQAKTLKDQNTAVEQIKPLIPMVEQTAEVKEEVALPTLYQPKSFLTISKEGGQQRSITDIIAKFSIDHSDYENMEVTEEQGKRINKALGRMVTGVAASVPILCRGSQCSYSETCPFFKENAHVVGEKCPVEVSLIEAWAQDFIEELAINPNSITEVQILSRLIEISVLERRLTLYMSLHEPDLTYEANIGVDEAGNVLTAKQSSISFEQRQRLDREKMRLLESLNATRERKFKIQSQIQEASKTDTSMQDLKTTIVDLAKALKLNNVVSNQ